MTTDFQSFLSLPEADYSSIKSQFYKHKKNKWITRKTSRWAHWSEIAGRRLLVGRAAKAKKNTYANQSGKCGPSFILCIWKFIHYKNSDRGGISGKIFFIHSSMVWLVALLFLTSVSLHQYICLPKKKSGNYHLKDDKIVHTVKFTFPVVVWQLGW